LSFLRRKKKELDDGSDWSTGTDSRYPITGSSPGLVPGGSFPGPGSSTADYIAYLNSRVSPGVNTNWQQSKPYSMADLGKLLTSSAMSIPPTGPVEFARQALVSNVLYGNVIYGSTPTLVPSTPSEPLETETREDPVRAWKRVKLERSGEWEMVSRMSGETFGGGISEAACRTYYPSNHALQSPDDSCSCGFYGYKQIEFEDFAPRYGSTPQPWLEVDFYGKVIECEKGFRAQYQQPLRLHVEESFFEFVGGKQINHQSDWMITTGVWTVPPSSVFDDPGYGVPVARKATCLTPNTLAQQIGIPVVVGGVEYK
jgi:hypothetical protein